MFAYVCIFGKPVIAIIQDLLSAAINMHTNDFAFNQIRYHSCVLLMTMSFCLFKFENVRIIPLLIHIVIQLFYEEFLLLLWFNYLNKSLFTKRVRCSYFLLKCMIIPFFLPSFISLYFTYLCAENMAKSYFSRRFFCKKSDWFSDQQIRLQ